MLLCLADSDEEAEWDDDDHHHHHHAGAWRPGRHHRPFLGRLLFRAVDSSPTSDQAAAASAAGEESLNDILTAALTGALDVDNMGYEELLALGR